MVPPVKPTEEDCCHSGCNPCIFDVYERQLKLYQKYLEKGSNGNEPSDNGISELVCTQFEVVKSTTVGFDHKIILFKRKQQDNKQVWWKPGQHFLIKYNGTNSICSRAYTPFKLKNDNSDLFDFSIVVKKYKTGFVSQFLFNLTIGETTLWRGPYGSYKFQPDSYNRIIMFAQGTGITPFLSIIENILINEDFMTKINLFVCYAKNAILFRDELYSFKSYWNFNYRIFLSDMVEIEAKYQEPIEFRKLKKLDIDNLKPFCPKDCFLLCGANQFIEDYHMYLVKENVSTQNIIKF